MCVSIPTKPIECAEDPCLSVNDDVCAILELALQCQVFRQSRHVSWHLSGHLKLYLLYSYSVLQMISDSSKYLKDTSNLQGSGYAIGNFVLVL